MTAINAKKLLAATIAVLASGAVSPALADGPVAVNSGSSARISAAANRMMGDENNRPRTPSGARPKVKSGKDKRSPGALGTYDATINTITLNVKLIHYHNKACVDQFNTEPCQPAGANIYYETMVSMVLVHEYLHATSTAPGTLLNDPGHIAIEYSHGQFICDELAAITAVANWQTDSAKFSTATALCDYNKQQRKKTDTVLVQQKANDVKDDPEPSAWTGWVEYPPENEVYTASGHDAQGNPDPSNPTGNNFIDRCPQCEASGLGCVNY